MFKKSTTNASHLATAQCTHLEANSTDSQLEELNARAGAYLDGLVDLNTASIYDVLNKTYVMIFFAKCLTIDVKFSLTKL